MDIVEVTEDTAETTEDTADVPGKVAVDTAEVTADSADKDAVDTADVPDSTAEVTVDKDAVDTTVGNARRTRTTPKRTKTPHRRARAAPKSPNRRRNDRTNPKKEGVDTVEVTTNDLTDGKVATGTAEVTAKKDATDTAEVTVDVPDNTAEVNAKKVTVDTVAKVTVKTAEKGTDLEEESTVVPSSAPRFERTAVGTDRRALF